jgi:hypothetical protein
MKNFKNVFFLTALAAVSVVFVGCDKDDDEEGAGIENGGFDGKIQATVSTGSVAVDAVKAFVSNEGEDYYEVASGKYENGGFTINLPATVPAKYLEQLFDDGIPKSIKISDTNAKAAAFFGIEAYKGEDEVGSFYYDLEVNDYSSIEAFFIYADRDVTITGSWTETDEEDWTSTETYNVSLKKGWNKMYEKHTASETNQTETSEVTTTELGGLKWSFYSHFYYEESASIRQVKAAKSVGKQRFSSIFK